MSDSAELRAIFARHLLGQAGQPITIKQGRARTLVTAGERQWLVSAIEEGPNYRRGPGYRLYDVGSRTVSDPPGQSDGLAVLPDGRSFYLNDPAGMRAFYRAASAVVTPLELASLLTWYQSTAAGAESLVAGRADLEDLLTPPDLVALPEPVAPVVAVAPDGALSLRFLGVYLSPEPPDWIMHVNLNAWQVTADAAGQLEWSCTPLARRLTSSRHAP